VYSFYLHYGWYREGAVKASSNITDGCAIVLHVKDLFGRRSGDAAGFTEYRDWLTPVLLG
jgi:hypothetical protein